MTSLAMPEKKVHQGKNVKRIRELLGVKQDALAADLGLTQQAISQLEQKEIIDGPVLDKIAKTLGVTAEAIKNYNEESTISIIANTYHDNSSILGQYHFNPLEKIVELYDALLKEKDSRIALLERFWEEKK